MPFEIVPTNSFEQILSHQKKSHPSKHFLLSKTSWRRLEDVFSVKNFGLPRCLEDVFNSRPLQDVFAIGLPKTSSIRLQDAFARCLQDVFMKTSCNRRRLAIMSWRRLGRHKDVTLKTSSRHLQDVFSTSSPKQMCAGIV